MLPLHSSSPPAKKHTIQNETKREARLCFACRNEQKTTDCENDNQNFCFTEWREVIPKKILKKNKKREKDEKLRQKKTSPVFLFQEGDILIFLQKQDRGGWGRQVSTSSNIIRMEVLGFAPDVEPFSDKGLGPWELKEKEKKEFSW